MPDDYGRRGNADTYGFRNDYSDDGAAGICATGRLRQRRGGHGMSYSPAAAAATEPPFDNVFVDPVSYGMFSRTGRWRKGTVLVLAIRGGHSKESINKQGAFKAGQPRAVEAHVMLFVSSAERGRRYDLRPISTRPCCR